MAIKYGEKVLEVRCVPLRVFSVFLLLAFACLFFSWNIFLIFFSQQAQINVLPFFLAAIFFLYLSYRYVFFDRKTPYMIVYEAGVWGRCFSHHKTPLFVPWDDVKDVSLIECGGHLDRTYCLLIEPHDASKYWQSSSWWERKKTLLNFKMFFAPLPVLITRNLDVPAHEIIEVTKRALNKYGVNRDEA
ncbi:MAG: STM3941 family protein [Pseudomonadota bacterium]|nr:STM3941 family protein [Pseudomonadota bacterium]MEE3323556.1 STM3941 family protein [Pseudomonadota bacterium]